MYIHTYVTGPCNYIHTYIHTYVHTMASFSRASFRSVAVVGGGDGDPGLVDGVCMGGGGRDRVGQVGGNS